MKKLLFLILLIPFFSNAATYYFSTTDGDDSRPTAMAQSSATPWKTITKFNSFFASLLPGDQCLFKRGDTFFGEMIISRSGTALAPIIVSSYGSGAAPIISGFYLIPSWTSLGGNKYSAVVSSAIPTGSTLPFVNMLTVNGAFQAIGRWPKLTDANSGYLTYQTHVGTTSITSTGIGSALSYVGGEVVIRANHFNINRGLISSQTSNTVTYTSIPGGPVNPLLDNFGFFFQNHVNTLTAQNEWCYESGTNTVKIYSTSTPTNIRISVLNNNISMSGRSYIIFDGLNLQGSNSAAIAITNSNHLTISNCTITLCGKNGISTNNNLSNTITVNNNSFSYVMNNGIDGNSSSAWTVTSNTFSNIGKVAGMGLTGDGTYQAISYLLDNNSVQLNRFTDCGFNCIMTRGNNNSIQNNFIDGFCSVKDDAGAIYSYLTTGATKTIQNNILINGIGAPDGTNGLGGGGAIGIYFDGQSTNVVCRNNSVAHCQQLGILLNDPNVAVITGNNVFDCGTAGQGGQIQINNNAGGQLVRNIINSRNFYVAKNTGQDCGLFYSPSDLDVNLFFTRTDSNYYARPIDQSTIVFKREASSLHYTLAQWQSFISDEAHSAGTPMAIADENDLRFEYNASGSLLGVSLGANSYIDMAGNVYTGTLTLGPWSSITLIKTAGGNTSPLSNAGVDQIITQPTSSTTLTGTGSDPDGTVASVLWSFVSGPVPPTIVSSGNFSTVVNGMTSTGVYTFSFKVTDNLGAFTTDSITVTVNAGANIPPTSNAGANQILTQPTSTTTVAGVASDPGGSVDSTRWSFISGPATPVILSPASSVTGITGLFATGDYTLRFTVTDNLGAVTSDDIIITVNAATPTLPGVQFRYFKYTAINSGDSLFWATDKEQGSKTFEIQQSSDGSTWMNIGSRTAAGTSNVLKTYNFFAGFPIQTTCVKKFLWWCTEKKNYYLITHYYYRIRGTDINGGVIYSIVIKT